MAEEVGAWLLADISHISGLVVAGEHQSPAEHAHIITTTTHKTLRGPRGAMIMATQKGLDKEPKLGRKINSAIIPGLQGGPHMNNIAALAVALEEASTNRFKEYAGQVVKNAKALAQSLMDNGLEVVSGGTDNHLLVADVRPLDILGKDAAILLEEAGIICNYNTVPFDPNPPFNPSGIRLGTPGCTTRGMKEEQMKQVGEWIAAVLKKELNVKECAKQVKQLCEDFPIPDEF